MNQTEPNILVPGSSGATLSWLSFSLLTFWQRSTHACDSESSRCTAQYECIAALAEGHFKRFWKPAEQINKRTSRSQTKSLYFIHLAFPLLFQKKKTLPQLHLLRSLPFIPTPPNPRVAGTGSRAQRSRLAEGVEWKQMANEWPRWW